MLALCAQVAIATAVFAQTAATDGATSSRATPAATGLLDSIRNVFGGASAPAELLPPEQAFQLQVRSRDADTLVATLAPAPDYYLYRDRISFSLVDAPGLAIAQVSLPPGKPKADPTFGTVQVYHRAVDAVITLRRDGDAPTQVSVRATYQGCNEPLGVCYPPIDKTVTVALRSDSSGSGVASAAAPSAVSAGSTTDLADDVDAVHRLFTQSSRWALVAAFFGFGLLLAFTPCMLPMIPILSGIIVGQRREMTRRHAFGLSAIYVLAMAMTYALAGVAAGLAGTMLSAYLQNPGCSAVSH